jgi:NADH:ubiquinone oxidoreductase subunit F (NADH-binding)
VNATPIGSLHRILTAAPPVGSSLSDHVDLHGEAPTLASNDGATLIDLVARAGLRGRGGAAFPTATKLAAVERNAASPPVVVVNGAEGEPASAKDRWCLESSPHLVLDGALLAAQAIGATDVFVCIRQAAATASVSVANAITEREEVDLLPAQVHLVSTPNSYLAGEETALIRFLNGGPAKPTFVPPRPFERGVGRRPTLVQNVETLAHLALIARHGPDWFRRAGTSEEPGTALVTLSGDVIDPGVYEIGFGGLLADLLAAAGGATGPVRAVLLGGYFGSWIDTDVARNVLLHEEHLRPLGGGLGSGVVFVLPDSSCGVAETARVISYLADEAAGQCGPCTNGLNAVASAIFDMARGTADATIEDSLERWGAIVPDRGACHHPNGAIRFVLSALSVFAEEFDDHRRHGPCASCAAAKLLPIPERPREWWRR